MDTFPFIFLLLMSEIGEWLSFLSVNKKRLSFLTTSFYFLYSNALYMAFIFETINCPGAVAEPSSGEA